MWADKLRLLGAVAVIASLLIVIAGTAAILWLVYSTVLV